MPSVFISYSHDPTDPTHAKSVARLAASLLRDGVKVFFDQNRGDEEEGVPWEIWMEDKIEEADYVLLVCTELYLKKVRQKVAADEGLGVCGEAGIIYALLYRLKRNTIKFLSVILSPEDKDFIPLPLQGKQWFAIDSQSGRSVAELDEIRDHFGARLVQLERSEKAITDSQTGQQSRNT